MVIERELKFMLDRAGYDAIHAWAHAAGRLRSEATQTNLYFDTPEGLLAAQHLCLRLRTKRGKWELTLKARFEFEAEEQVCEETNTDLSAADAQAFQDRPQTLATSDLPPAVRLRELCNPSTLVALGALATKRAVIDLEGGFVGELDHSTYLGTEDFELECETDDPARAGAAIRAMFAEVDVDAVRSDRPKLARFMARYR